MVSPIDFMRQKAKDAHHTFDLRSPLPENRARRTRRPRQINRNLVFNLIRTRQPSRVPILPASPVCTQHVSLIVEDLIQERWVLEGSTGRLPRGRRPTFLELNHQRAVIALDIHPSQTTVAVTDLGGKIVAQNVVELPERSE